MRLRLEISAPFLILLLLTGAFRPVLAEEITFPLLPGLEGAVDFWKQVFARYSANEVIFHDPQEPAKIYSVLRVPENDQGRAMIEKESRRIAADYDLREEDGRVRPQRGAKEQFLSGLKLSGRYLSQMQKILRTEGVPVELAYLPLVESAFNVHARSAAGAVGMWQFMESTGKKFLRVNKAIDERKDPFASTRAAARLLKENYRILGNWPLAITAYNHGADGVLRAVNTVGSQNLVDLIRRYQSPSFGYASKNFYAEFLAALDVAQNNESYFPTLRLHDPLGLQEVEIKRAVGVQSLLKAAVISREELLQWNPALRSTAREIPAGYRVYLPPENAKRFAAASAGSRSASVTKRREASSWAQHRVAAGETLLKIARSHRVSVAAIRKANGLGDGHSIFVGQRLRIPRL